MKIEYGPLHTCQLLCNYLNENSHASCLGRCGSLEWPARSPDHMPLDYFLGGHLQCLDQCNDVL